MIGLFIFMLLSIAAIIWWRLVKARELARSAAATACREHGLVLMDDTVVLHALDTHRWRRQRLIGLLYRFDFARGGVLTRGGRVLILPGQPPVVVITTPEGQLIETL